MVPKMKSEPPRIDIQEYQQEMSLCPPWEESWTAEKRVGSLFLDRRVKEAPWRAPRLQLRGSALNLIGSELISRLYEIVREYRLD